MSQLLEHAQRILESARGDEEIEVYVASGVDTRSSPTRARWKNSRRPRPTGSAFDPERRCRGARVERRGPVRSTTKPSSTRFARPVTTRLSPPRTSSSRSRARRRRSGVTHVERRRRREHATGGEDRDGDRAGTARARWRHAHPTGRLGELLDYVAEAAIASTTGIRASYARTGAYVSSRRSPTMVATTKRLGPLGRASPHELDVEKAAADAIRRATRMLGAVKPNRSNARPYSIPGPRQHFSRLSAEH